mmetsp:Transcript_9503/g.31502  ORF Transcript_9503/g.31502 Transcript_9503/m.31502 type:complete len:201 (+) Transcript_9503:85-687(+)
MPDVAYGTPVADTGPVPLGTPVYPPPPVSPAAAAPAVNQHAFDGRDDFSRPLPMRVGGCGVKRHIGGRVLLPDWLHVSGCCATLTVDTREMLQPDHPHGAEIVIGSQCGSLSPPYFCCSSLTLLVSPDRPASAAPPVGCCCCCSGLTVVKSDQRAGGRAAAPQSRAGAMHVGGSGCCSTARVLLLDLGQPHGAPSSLGLL